MPQLNEFYYYSGFYFSRSSDLSGRYHRVNKFQFESCILTGCVADLSVSTWDTVKAANWLALPDSLPGAWLTVLTAH